MVPKESGFNRSVAAYGMCARKAWRFPGSPATTRDSGNMAILLTSLLFVFEISFLPEYRVNYYDYIVKWCFGI